MVCSITYGDHYNLGVPVIMTHRLYIFIYSGYCQYLTDDAMYSS